MHFYKKKLLGHPGIAQDFYCQLCLFVSLFLCLFLSLYLCLYLYQTYPYLKHACLLTCPAAPLSLFPDKKFLRLIFGWTNSLIK
jgi:hypothetical protein